MSSHDWFNKKLLVSGKVKLEVDRHEHLVTEQDIRASEFTHVHVPSHLPSLVQVMTRPRGAKPSTTSSPSSEARDLLASTSRPPLRPSATSSSTRSPHGLQEGEEKRHSRGRKVGQNDEQGRHKGPLARFGIALVACVAAYAPFLAFPASVNHNTGAMAEADPRHDEGAHLAHQTWELRPGTQNLCTAQNLQECSQFRNRVGWSLAFLEAPILDGMLAARYMKGQASKIRQADSRGKGSSKSPRPRSRATGCSSTARWTEGRLANVEGRSLEACNFAQAGGSRKDEGHELKDLIRPIYDRHLKGGGRAELRSHLQDRHQQQVQPCQVRLPKQRLPLSAYQLKTCISC